MIKVNSQLLLAAGSGSDIQALLTTNTGTVSSDSEKSGELEMSQKSAVDLARKETDSRQTKLGENQDSDNFLISDDDEGALNDT